MTLEEFLTAVRVDLSSCGRYLGTDAGFAFHCDREAGHTGGCYVVSSQRAAQVAQERYEADLLPGAPHQKSITAAKALVAIQEEVVVALEDLACYNGWDGGIIGILKARLKTIRAFAEVETVPADTGCVCYRPYKTHQVDCPLYVQEEEENERDLRLWAH